MGLFDYVSVSGPEYVCSAGHDLSGESFQSKDFGCGMGNVYIANDRLTFQEGYLGTPALDENPAEIYCTCTQCPAFVQFGTGNLIGCDVTFSLVLDGDTVKTVTRTSPDSDAFVRDTSLHDGFDRCEGPMSYPEAEALHINYREMRPAQYDEFRRWADARCEAALNGEEGTWTLRVGEFPKGYK